MDSLKAGHWVARTELNWVEPKVATMVCRTAVLLVSHSVAKSGATTVWTWADWTECCLVQPMVVTTVALTVERTEQPSEVPLVESKVSRSVERWAANLGKC